MNRSALYSGTWYPDSRTEIQKYVNSKIKSRKVIAAVCPHAGWVYSGKVAGLVYSSMQPADLYVLVGPNHTGDGGAVGVYPEGEWETPLGSLEIEKDVSKAIVENFRGASLDFKAHLKEHSLEVQMPFIKLISPQAKIVCVALGDYSSGTCQKLSGAIVKALKKYDMDKKMVIIASTDMSHYVSADTARVKDDLAIRKMLSLDAAGLLDTVNSNKISMCGSGPAATAILAAIELGAESASLVSYSNSGYMSGDFDQVVGYAGLIIV